MRQYSNRCGLHSIPRFCKYVITSSRVGALLTGNVPLRPVEGCARLFCQCHRAPHDYTLARMQRDRRCHFAGAIKYSELIYVAEDRNVVEYARFGVFRTSCQVEAKPGGEEAK